MKPIEKHLDDHGLISDLVRRSEEENALLRASLVRVTEERDRFSADAKARAVVLDAIHETLTEAGYDLPLAEQVGAVIQERDALASYAQHDWSCRRDELPSPGCTCGLDEIIGKRE